MLRIAPVLTSLFALSCAAPSPEQAPSTSGSQLSSQLPATRRIAGRIVDGAGQPVGARVSLVSSSGSVSSRSSDGRFDFANLRHDAYVLMASSDQGRLVLLPRVEHGTQGLVLKAEEEGAYVEFEMTGHPKARLAIFHDDLRLADNTVRDGRAERFLVPAGSTRYSLYGEGVDREAKLELKPGETRKLGFNLAP